MNFDYEKFEKNVFVAVEEYAKSQLINKDDLYIMSIEYFPEFTTSVGIRANTYSYLKEQVEDEEDYTYYKYCEEEWDWDLYEDLEEISRVLQVQYNEMEEKYGEEFYELQQEHATKIIEVCKTVMKRFKETNTYKKFPMLYLNVYVREYFTDEESVQMFCELNGKDKIDEYKL